MSKIEEAQEILKAFGLPKLQQNKISALTLLALSGIQEDDEWSTANNERLTLSKDIIEFVNRNYKQNYKPNTRESFRKIALTPFVSNNIVNLNPDDPSLSPRSSKTHYALSDLTLQTIQKFKTKEWQKAIDYFKTNRSLKNKVEIKNFKSIKHVEFEISRINVFIGRPNSGKSNLLEALTLFNFLHTKDTRSNFPNLIRFNTLDNLFYDRNLSEEIQISLHENVAIFLYENNLDSFFHIINPSQEFLKMQKRIANNSISIIEAEKQIPFLSNEIKNKFSSKYAVLTNEGKISSTSQIKSDENPIRRYEFKDGVKYGDKFQGHLKSFGENLFTIVQGNSMIREWVNSFFDEYNLEFLMDFSSRVFEIQKKQQGIVYKIPFELTPDTFRRMLFHVAAIYSNKKATILLEEPESHSFPPYVRELSELIKSDISNTYFITTHSPYFFNNMVEDSKKNKDISFFHVYYENYETRVKRLTNKELNNIWGSGADVFFNIDSLDK